MYSIIKRDGKVVDFDLSKISGAIEKAFIAQKREYNKQIIDMLALNAVSDSESKAVDGKVDVESIQDSVETTLQRMGYEDVAKAYILYRNQREKIRNMNSALLNYKNLVDSYVKIEDWRVKENSTVTYSVGGLILSNSGAITVSYTLNTTLHCAGGIVGLHEGFKISGCSNTGALNTTLNCPTGGLIGLQLDAALSTGEGCTVVCDITSGQASTGGMLVGVYSGTAAFTMGSSSNPIKVAGSINGAAASASNLCGSASASQPTFNTNL